MAPGRQVRGPGWAAIGTVKYLKGRCNFSDSKHSARETPTTNSLSEGLCQRGISASCLASWRTHGALSSGRRSPPPEPERDAHTCLGRDACCPVAREPSGGPRLALGPQAHPPEGSPSLGDCFLHQGALTGQPLLWGPWFSFEGGAVGGPICVSGGGELALSTQGLLGSFCLQPELCGP